MASVDMLHPQYEAPGFEGQLTRHEVFLGWEERDEKLLAAATFLGPIATIATFETAPRSGEFYRPFAQPLAEAAPQLSAEFNPDAELDSMLLHSARKDMATAAIMFAFERPDLQGVVREDLELAA